MAYNKDIVFRLIGESTDAKKLGNWIENARREGAKDVEVAAINRLIEVSAKVNHDDADSPLVLDFWKSITALEFALSDERGKTIRLTRTRQKIARVGVKQTLADLAVSPKPSEGFFLLKERNMLDMSAESVILRHAHEFEQTVLDAAQTRLKLA